MTPARAGLVVAFALALSVSVESILAAELADAVAAGNTERITALLDSTDIGEHMLFSLHDLTAHAPDTFQIQLNLGSMGSGIAGAIGLALADRSRPVVCICGDGGMQMLGMEALVAGAAPRPGAPST